MSDRESGRESVTESGRASVTEWQRDTERETERRTLQRCSGRRRGGPGDPWSTLGAIGETWAARSARKRGETCRRLRCRRHRHLRLAPPPPPPPPPPPIQREVVAGPPCRPPLPRRPGPAAIRRARKPAPRRRTRAARRACRPTLVAPPAAPATHGSRALPSRGPGGGAAPHAPREAGRRS